MARQQIYIDDDLSNFVEWHHAYINAIWVLERLATYSSDNANRLDAMSRMLQSQLDFMNTGYPSVHELNVAPDEEKSSSVGEN